jgi:putative multiple sugar transport system ATP-binding protein
MTTPLLSMRGICKSFPGVKALHNVNLDIHAGEIHAIVGENGAGKSTLMKVLSGVYPHGTYEGEIHVDGALQRFAGIRESEDAGVIIIHQELALVPLLSVAENIFLGHEPARGGVVDAATLHRRTQAVLQRVGLHVPPHTPVGELGVGQQQLVEIAKALVKRVKLLILDEPTASLSDVDSEALLRLLLELRGQGIACVLISHKLNEVMRVADRVTVLRDGTTIETLAVADEEISEDRLIRGMVGRDLASRYPPRTASPGHVLFEVRDWQVQHTGDAHRTRLSNVNFHVREGEIVGIAGLMGSGRTELAMSLFGRSYGQGFRGEVRMDGDVVDVSTVGRAIAHGLAYVSEDRKDSGLVLDQSIRHNLTLAHLAGVARWGVIQHRQEHGVARHFQSALRIRCASTEQPVVHLSGGNQQKVVLGKWLFTEPRLLILDEPTRGIDVGAKYEIYSLMNELTQRGQGLLMISSDMPELLGMCDRLYVMNEGRFVAELDRAHASQEAIMRAIVHAQAAAAPLSS